MENSERCWWCGSDTLYVSYHDHEWARPLVDSRALWELLILEGFQAGLSWLTILRKRPAFRDAFQAFHAESIAAWGESDVQRLLSNPGIVRHRGKIEATISNAKAVLKLEERQSFASFLWDFVDGVPLQTNLARREDIQAITPLSQKLSKALIQHGFRFTGPTTVQAFMQSSGMVNDHLVTCPCHAKVAALGGPVNLDRPSA